MPCILLKMLSFMKHCFLFNPTTCHLPFMIFFLTISFHHLVLAPFIHFFPSSTNSNPTTSTKFLISSTSRPNCVTKPPTYLQDYYCYFTTLAPIFVLYPLFSVLGYDKLSPSHRALIHAISSHVEPTSYTQATMIPEW